MLEMTFIKRRPCLIIFCDHASTYTAIFVRPWDNIISRVQSAMDSQASDGNPHIIFLRPPARQPPLRGAEDQYLSTGP